MPSFADSIFLFVLALVLFGPKKLPVLARELGKWVGEFRRASNEFKMQMEEELRASEQAERQKQVAAMEAAAPIPPPLEEPEHPHLRPKSRTTPEAQTSDLEPEQHPQPAPTLSTLDPPPLIAQPAPQPTEASENTRPVPIATSGALHMMPPATGLPTPRGRGSASQALHSTGGLVVAQAEQELDIHTPAEPAPEPESLAHGD